MQTFANEVSTSPEDTSLARGRSGLMQDLRLYHAFGRSLGSLALSRIRPPFSNFFSCCHGLVALLMFSLASRKRVL